MPDDEQFSAEEPPTEPETIPESESTSEPETIAEPEAFDHPQQRRMRAAMLGVSAALACVLVISAVVGLNTDSKDVGNADRPPTGQAAGSAGASAATGTAPQTSTAPSTSTEPRKTDPNCDNAVPASPGFSSDVVQWSQPLLPATITQAQLCLYSNSGVQGATLTGAGATALATQLNALPAACSNNGKPCPEPLCAPADPQTLLITATGPGGTAVVLASPGCVSVEAANGTARRSISDYASLTTLVTGAGAAQPPAAQTSTAQPSAAQTPAAQPGVPRNVEPSHGPAIS